MKKICELCKGLARMHCESDQASLCWTCDFNVHTANFLVARHSRTLLCHVCQSPTPWTATGTKIGLTVSLCDNCLLRNNGNRPDEDDLEDEENEAEVESEEDEVDIDNEDNQVVPWSPTTPPPRATSSSNCDEEEQSYSSSSASSSLPSSQRKRMRENVADLSSTENRCCTAYLGNVNKPPETVVDSVDSLSTRSSKRRRPVPGRVGLFRSNSRDIVESIKRLHRQEMRSSAAVAEFCRLSECPSTVESDSSECS